MAVFRLAAADACNVIPKLLTLGFGPALVALEGLDDELSCTVDDSGKRLVDRFHSFLRPLR